MKRLGGSRRRGLVVSCVTGVVALGVAAAAVGAVGAGAAPSAPSWQSVEPGYPRVALPPLQGVAPVIPGAGDSYPRVVAPHLAGVPAPEPEDEEGDLAVSSVVPWRKATVMGVEERFKAAEDRCTAGDVMCMVRLATGSDLTQLTRDVRDLQSRVSRLEKAKR